MKLIDTTGNLYDSVKADAIAAEMNVFDPDWHYTAVHDPKGTGYAFITIHDEDGNYIGKF